MGLFDIIRQVLEVRGVEPRTVFMLDVEEEDLAWRLLDEPPPPGLGSVQIDHPWDDGKIEVNTNCEHSGQHAVDAVYAYYHREPVGGCEEDFVQVLTRFGEAGLPFDLYPLYHDMRHQWLSHDKAVRALKAADA